MANRKLYDDAFIEHADLCRLRQCRSLASVAESGNSNMSVEEAATAFHNDMSMLAELRKKYQIPVDESVGFSLLDGAIIDTEEVD